MPRKLSYSSLSVYSACPAKWHFKYVLKIPEEPKHYFSFGKAVHSALERMYDQPYLPGIELLLEAYDNAWSSAGYKKKEDEAKARKQGEAMIRAFYQQNAPTWQAPIGTELKFDFRINDIQVIGVIDRIDGLGNGDLHIIDYKTGKPLEEGREIDDEQLTMYQLAADMLGIGKATSLSLVHVPSGRWHTAPRHSDELVEKLKDKIVDTAEAIDTGRFEAKPSEDACKWCDYKRMCSAWGPE
jgi:putative RecB family exonuclease